MTVNGKEIICSTEHPFYSPIKGWTSACQLRAGDILVFVNGEYVIVEQVQHEILETPVVIYNFEVADFHTYYVGKQKILVHNKCFRGRLQDLTGASDEAVASMDAHHVFPQKYKSKFKKMHLDYDNAQYGSWVDSSIHRGFSYEYNQDWKFFFKESNVTLEQTLDFGRMLAQKYGFNILF